MLDKLAEINVRFEEVGEKLTMPDVVADQKKFAELSKQFKDLEPIVKVYKEYKNVLDNIESSKEILEIEDDPEMKEMAKMEIEELSSKKDEMDEEIKLHMTSRKRKVAIEADFLKALEDKGYHYQVN